MRALAAATLLLTACAHGSADNARTTLAQQQRMKERAFEEERNAPYGARISGRHGPRACYDRWVYASEEKFETCVYNWRNTEQQRAMGNTRGPSAAQVISAIAVVAAASAPQRLVCADRTLSPTCTDDGWHQGCCSSHGGMLLDAAGNPVFAVGE